MDIRLLSAFLIVAEEGSVSAAAQRCGYSQPALSQQLQALERLLGRRLFDRAPQGMTLTEEGRVAYPYARALVGLFEELRDASPLFPSGPGRQRTAGTAGTAGTGARPAPAASPRVRGQGDIRDSYDRLNASGGKGLTIPVTGASDFLR